MRERTKQISLVVMASGFGRRYGGNKLLELFRGKELYRYVLEMADGSGADSIIVVTRFPEIKNYIQNKYPKMRVVWNDHPEHGISESLRLGLEASGEMDGCCFMVCDQPLFREDSLKKLFQKFQDNPNCIVACTDGKKQGNPVIFPQDLFGELMELSGDQGGRQIIGKHKERLLNLKVSSWELMDIDCVTDKDEMEYIFAKIKYMR